MHSKRRTAFIFFILFTGALLVLVFGVQTKRITYCILGDEVESYTETYYLLFDQNKINLSVPAKDNSNIEFTGWYYDKELQNKAENQIILTDDLVLYASWKVSNPDTDFLLPEIHIISNADLQNVDRWEYNACEITITNTTLNHCLKQVPGFFRGRGNSTWEKFEKKPYKIKFEDRQNLFGMGADKDWILLSNSVDYTLMRNEIALNLGMIFDLPYTSQCQWVHLFYNDEYQGLYLLCEQVETGINRIDIEIPYEPDDIDISFFLELGGGLDGFTVPLVENAENNWEDYFSCQIVYPEEDVLTKHQYEYMYTYIDLVNTAILTKNWQELTELVDIQSFADWYLVNEIMLNGDMGWSMFAYKPQGEKLYLGPIWDFDQSCGVSIRGGTDYETWYPVTGSQNAWFNTLIEMDEFKLLLKDRWVEKLPEIQTYLKTESEKASIYHADIKANFDRWPTIGTTSWRIQEEIGELKTYEENVTYLFDWLHHRIEWIDKELSSL